MRCSPFVLSVVSIFAAGCGSPPAPDSTPPMHDAFAVELARLNTLGDPSDPTWERALQAVEATGDGFALQRLEAVAAEPALVAEEAQRVDAAIRVLRMRVDEAGAIDEEELRFRLERSAYADLQCDRLERELWTWTEQDLAARLDDPLVVTALERITTDYEPAPELLETLAKMQARRRVPEYARAILAARSEPR